MTEGKSPRGLRLQKRLRLIGALCACVLAPSAPASAQDEPNAAETAAARTMALEGIKLADAGHCDEALDKLARAEKPRKPIRRMRFRTEPDPDTPDERRGGLNADAA